MFKSDERRLEESQPRLIVLERNDKAEHRAILEYNVIDQNRDKQEVQSLVLGPVLLQLKTKRSIQRWIYW